MTTYFGFDPGSSSGAIAEITSDGTIEHIACDETERDIWDWLDARTKRGGPFFAVIERVHAMPKQGVSSAFNFGGNYGFMRGILVASCVPFTEVSPATWQGAMKCRSKGNKNVTKARAQQLYPGIKFTHRNADATLLATYARDLREGRLVSK